MPTHHANMEKTWEMTVLPLSLYRLVLSITWTPPVMSIPNLQPALPVSVSENPARNHHGSSGLLPLFMRRPGHPSRTPSSPHTPPRTRAVTSPWAVTCPRLLFPFLLSRHRRHPAIEPSSRRSQPQAAGRSWASRKQPWRIELGEARANGGRERAATGSTPAASRSTEMEELAAAALS